MLILLPPSERKSVPTAGEPVDLSSLSFPEITNERREMLAALVRLCRMDPLSAMATLGLGPRQADDIRLNAELTQSPTARADEIYTGVLYEALALSTAETAVVRRAENTLLIVSSLWGLLRPSDRIPAYRLGGGVSMPGLGRTSSFWRPVLPDLLSTVATGQLMVDLRSSTYVSFWRPGPELTDTTVTVRVLHERDGHRTVASHFNKATKGHLVRALLDDNAQPSSPKELALVIDRLGWHTEITAPARIGRPWTIDVVIRPPAGTSSRNSAAES